MASVEPNESDADMRAALRSNFASALKDFAASSAKFRVLRSVPSESDSPSLRTRFLHVTDSSFNPPSRAHLRIATSALEADAEAGHGHQDQRLLLLLATQNADKKVKPAPFEERLVMMTLLAEEVRRRFSKVVVDVGVTKEPFFHAKALAIGDSGFYGSADDPVQMYGVGFDSLLRIFDGRYYGNEGFKVLRPFFAGCTVRATLRTDDQWGDEKAQKEFVDRIVRGDREGEGIEKDWGKRIELVQGRRVGEEVVSSTQAREAVRDQDWTKLNRMCVESVADYVRGAGLYDDESKRP